MSKLTPWIDGELLPARRGVYQRKHPAGVLYSRWSKYGWMFASVTAQGAARQTALSNQQHAPWRGLAAAPEGRAS
jgi:hypothetical protein